jgi:hypothetical protein
MAFTGTLHSFASFSIAATFFFDRSMAVASAAPLETASKEKMPEPAKRSRKWAPTILGPTMLKNACLARSEVGRTSRGGTGMRRPRSVPAVMRSAFIGPTFSR